MCIQWGANVFPEKQRSLVFNLPTSYTQKYVLIPCDVNTDLSATNISNPCIATAWIDKSSTLSTACVEASQWCGRFQWIAIGY